MVSDDLDVPQIALVGERPILGASSATSTNSFPPVGRTSSPFDVHDFLSLPTPILRNSRNSLDVPTYPTLHLTDPLYPPPSRTLSARSLSSNRWVTSTVLRNDNPEENDGLSSLGLLTPLSQGHHRKICAGTVASIGSNFIDRDNCSSSLKRPGISDVPSIHTSHTNTHVDAVSDTSRPSLAAGFFKRTVQRIRRLSPSPSAETDMGSETTREAGLNVEPFAFNPFQLANLVYPKSLENLERLGGVDGLLRGLGTNRRRGLSTKLTQPALRDPKMVNAVHRDSDGEEATPTKPEPMIACPIGVPEGLRRTACLGGGSSHPTPLQLSAGAYKATIQDRQRIYGQNILPQRPTKSLLHLTWLALQDKVIVLLSIAAVGSLALGLFQDFGTHRPQGEPPVDWVEGVAIIVAILVVVAVGSLNDWQEERQFRALDEKKEDRLVKVIRDGEEQQIDVHQVVVGDVVLLEPGEVAPCDGIFLSGYNVWCDESTATGESDTIKKLSYDECVALRDKRVMEFDPDGPSGDGESVSASQRKANPSGLESLGHADCFIVSGSKIVEGVGSYVVISVGTKNFNGRIMMAMQRDPENTPLQLKLNDVSEIIAKIGSVAGGLLFAALLVRYSVQLGINHPQRTSSEKAMAFVNILIIALTLVVVAVHEGLPLTALAFATKRMFKQNLLVRVLRSCETMANVSVICVDKTGTLTQNEMAVVAVSVGAHAKFVRSLEENRACTGSEALRDPNVKDIGVDFANLNTVLSHQLKDFFNAAIATNPTAFEGVDPESGSPVFIGSKTETALLGFAKELGWPDYKDIRDSANIIQMIPFSSDRKSMGCVVRLADGSHRLYVKGASEVLARKCTRHVVAYRANEDEASGSNEVETTPIGEMEEDNISHTIAFYASQSLRTIALCYRDSPCWPPQGARLLGKDEAMGQVDYDDLTTDLTLICIAAIEDPLRSGVREAVADCGKAGVRVKMCTGDNVLTARSIAQQCGIYTPGGIVMEGPRFRTLSPGVMKAIVPRLQVLARSSPEDKRILVKTLKELGEVVGVTGAGTDDGPTLKAGHVGFSMGIAGVELAKEASDIILMDDNFSSIFKAIMWGRCVNDSVRKFLQFQISAYFTTVVIMIVWALASSSEKPIFGAVQLLWINIIMGTFATLALTTDPTSPVLLDRKPDKKTDPLFTVDMTKQILGQVAYQIVITLTLHFLGSRVLGFRHTDDLTLQEHHLEIVQTLVFNAFVFAQVSNTFNCRRLDRKLNVFEGVSKNRYFMAITIIEVVVQVLICLVGGAAFGVTRMGIREWCISVALGCISLPLGALIRLTPNEPFEGFFKRLKLLPEPELLPTIRPDTESDFSFAMDQVRDSLGTFAKLRGGVVHESRFAFPCPDGPDPLSIDLPCFRHGSLAMVPSPDVSHFAAPEWQPRTSGPLSDPLGFGRLGSSAALRKDGFEVHPDTPRDDPVYVLLSVIQRPVTTR
ncbi:calcium-translocating P-type ATPase [Lactarius hengduanensis]|nr:calcium-translocating P-type ATPase [Lactarius hengduanensis]